MLRPDEQRKAASAFVERWQDRGNERQDSQTFWLDLLENVYGIDQPGEYISFEDQVHLDHTSFIDGYITATNVMIEQKGRIKDLRKGIKQSDGTFLTPFQQAQRYAMNLPYSQRPRWIITCNFTEFYVYDMERPGGDPAVIALTDLPEECYRLDFLVDQANPHLEKEMQVSMQAGELVGQIYDELLKQYRDPNSDDTQRAINQLSVRLVFCLYAEDAGIFGRHGMFHDYLADFDTRFLRNAVIDLFRVLDTPIGKRDPYLDEKLAEFPYVNGGMFADEDIEIPQFTDELRTLLLEHASADFDWSQISPTIFGAVFESTLNPETRRQGGMHYTSIENIHKLIDPLFLNELRTELEDIKKLKQPATVKRRAAAFQDKLAGLTFLDPACGSGNFLTETYLSLRKLENDAIRLIYGDQNMLALEKQIIKVSIQQFYGFEINDFAVSVGKTALWIAESQMMEETKSIVYTNIDFLPLKTYTNITEGNALRFSWSELVPANQLNYIIGNPPFNGARLMSKVQKEDLLQVDSQIDGIGSLDYVAGWYLKAAQIMQGHSILTAFVSTNSITQGEQVEILWKPMLERYGVHIDFAYRTFKWTSEAKEKASVFCVIIGFSKTATGRKVVYSSSGQPEIVTHINPYLVDAQDAFVKNRSKPLCSVPPISIGNLPIDGGNYLFEKDEMESFIKAEPESKRFFKPWYGSREFINRKPRYCLWVGDATPSELRKMPHVLERIERVQEFRLASTRAATRKLADKPTRFHFENMPTTNFLVIPKVSSEKRRYIPIGYMTPDNLASDLVFVVPDANLYEFGVLTSNVHMAWMRTVAGRLKSDYRYSAKVVYNNFPWPHVTADQQAKIAETAQQILDARALYPDSSYADLYDERTMPSELRKAHQNNDRAVMRAYGMDVATTTEGDSVAKLFTLYAHLAK
ncbi:MULTISPECIES: class I SAM-dependent DNA methyltransferase [Lacticaseibacillus]|uniref:site-specific DNA-methyltransferase (adenine-specific) n=1 Tax=Lacticaseibacillus mingshuiensis TaxID=2799574 RepID=A0ABW4CHG0_9LACO|nr:MULTISPECIES: class I SAM-dependent DNA methyltransferase [Lacticaseibacillus]